MRSGSSGRHRATRTFPPMHARLGLGRVSGTARRRQRLARRRLFQRQLAPSALQEGDEVPHHVDLQNADGHQTVDAETHKTMTGVHMKTTVRKRALR